MATKRPLLCSPKLCLVLAVGLLFVRLFPQESNLKGFGLQPTWFLFFARVQFHTVNHLLAPRSNRFYSSRVACYSNSNSTFQLQRLLRSGDTAVSKNPGPSSIKCYLQNVRSLKAAVAAEGDSFEYKTALLKDVAYGYDLDIICLTETWLNDSISNYQILPTGYNIFRRDREDRVGGGTLNAIKSHLSTREISVIPLSLEAVVVEIALNSCQTLLFIVCYRSPSEIDFIPKFKSLLDPLQLDKYRGVFIVGDFNYPGIEWIDGSGFTNSITSEEQQFASLIMDLYLFQLVDRPTRKKNILDLVITNSPSTVSSIDSGPYFAEAGLPSDHYPVVFDIDFSGKLKDSNHKFCFDFKIWC